MDLPRCFRLSLPVVAALAFGGCFAEVDSTDVTTDSLFANAKFTSSDGVATDVRVALTVGGASGTAVVLRNGDRLAASARGRTLPLAQRDDGLGNITYGATFPDGGENVAFSLEFLRGDTSSEAQSCGQTSAVGSFVFMPRPFEVAPMMAGVTLRSRPLLSWSNTGPSPMNVDLRGSCVVGGRARIVDVGAFEVPAAWMATLYPNGPIGCTVRVEVSRCATGEVSRGFGEGGIISACQERTSSFRVTP